MRLFIVDDSEILLDRLKTVLSDITDIEIVGQTDRQDEIVEAIVKLKPDVVILDIRLQAGNGVLALEDIKKMENPPAVIMFTNYPYLQYRKKCIEAGADYFFYKAVEFEKLIDLLEELVRKKE